MEQSPETPEAQKKERSAGRQMTVGALVISAFLFAGKTAGYVKDMAIAGYFSKEVNDIFYAIYNNIVTMFYSKIEKLLRPTFLPQFVKQLATDEKTAWRLASVVFNVQLLGLILVVAVLEVFAAQILRMLIPNMTADPEMLRIAVGLLRIMAPSLLLFSPSVMPELILHSYKRFTTPAVADCLMRIVLVATLFVCVENLWHPEHPQAVYAAALGVLVAYPLRFIAQLPALVGKLRNYALSLDFSTPGVRTVFALMPPVVVGLLFSAARGVADTVYSDRVGAGVYAALNFARRVTDAPLQILPLAVSFVVYPFISQWVTEGAKDKLADALVSMTRAMAFLFVPAAVAIMLLSDVIISVMFEHGKFGPESTQLAAVALWCYAIGMMAYSVEASINKWYFALEDTATPNFIGAAAAVLHILIGYVGVFILGAGEATLGRQEAGIAAIALALTISKTVKVVILYSLILRRIGAIDWPAVWSFTIRLAMCTGLMALAMWAILQFSREAVMAWEPPFGGKKAQMLALFAIAGGPGAVAFIAAAAALRLEEFSLVWSRVGSKVMKRFGR